MTAYNKRSENTTVANVFCRYSMGKVHIVQAERRIKAMSTTISTEAAATQNGNCITIRRHRVPRNSAGLTKGMHFPVHISHGFGIWH